MFTVKVRVTGHIALEGKKSFSLSRDRRFNPRLYQYVVSMSTAHFRIASVDSRY